MRRSRLEDDFVPAAAGAVDGVHDLERLVSLFARDQRPAALLDGLAEIAELPLEWRERDRHGVGRPGGDVALDRRGLARIVLDVPRGQLVAGDDGGPLGPVKFGALGIAGPEGSRGLDHARGAVGKAKHGVDYILRFDLVPRAQLPGAEQLVHRPGQPAQDIDLVDRLIDQRAAALRLPTALDGPRIIFGRTEPLHIGVALQELAEPSGGDGALEEQRGIVEPVLAHHAQQDAAAPGGLDHLPRGFEVGRDRLLHLHVLAGLGADCDGLKAEVREGADVDVVHLGVAADLLEGADEFAAVLIREPPAACFENIGADRQLESDVAIHLGVLVRDRARADHSDSHGSAYCSSRWRTAEVSESGRYNETSRMKRHFATYAATAGALALASCKHTPPPNVAAEVNGQVITYADLDKLYQTQYPQTVGSNEDQVMSNKLEVLNSMITTEIMRQRAEKLGLTALDADVDAEFNKRTAGLTKEEIEKRLAERHMTIADAKAQIRRDLTVDKLINKEITSHIMITDSDVTNFYNANKGSFNLAEPQVHLAQILVTPFPNPNVRNLKNSKAQTDAEAQTKIKDIADRLKRGEDFGMIAQNYSEDPDSAPNGGDMGFIPQSNLEKASPELRHLVDSLEPGQYSAPIHTQDGYRILKVLTREPAGQRDLNDPRVQQSIRETLLNRKDQLLKSAYYEVQRNNAKIRNYLAQSIVQGASK